MSSGYRHCLRFDWVSALATLFLLLLGTGFVSAEPLYQQLVESAKVSDETLQKARKQIEEHQEVEVLENLSVAAFHQREKSPPMAKQPLCQTCHLALPHQNNERSRTFMNMHSRYIACETCHLQPRDLALEYRWVAYDGHEAGLQLPPRQITALTGANEQPEPASLAPQAGARIAPFFNDTLALLFKDSDFAKKIKRQWEAISRDQRAELKARLHAPLEEEGPACQSCHGKEQPLLDLGLLGATTKQANAIEKNSIARFFSRFKKDDGAIRIGKELLK